jgi:arginine utilization protein RocB
LGVEAAVPPVETVEAATLLAEVTALDPDGFRAEGERVAQAGLDLPEQCRRLTAWAWSRTGRSGPAVVIGFGSLPYPAVRLGETPLARRLAEAVETARLKAQAASGESLRVIAFFPGISDMSFLGEADTAGVQLIAANTPAWACGVRWSGEVGAIPTVNIGPWGRDYHTPLERLHAPFAFDVLPALVLDAAREALRREA